MPDSIPLAWVRKTFRSAPPAADAPKAQLQVEQLEKRWLFNATEFLPRRPVAIEGVTGSSQDLALVQPLTGDLLYH
jgi:hypothetical protein